MGANTQPFIAKHGLRVVDYIAADGTIGATIVGHISATGNIWTSAGQIGTLGTSLCGDTFKSTTAYHYISSFSNTWTSAYTDVYNTSGTWNSVWTTVNQNSAIWTWVADNSASAGDGNSAFATLQSNSGKWDSTYTTLNANSADWIEVESTVRSNSATWSGAVSSGGGWTDDGTIVRLTDAGEKVGIGTVTPGEKLSVAGAISAQTIVYGDTSNSNQWGSNWTTTNANSGLWSNTYTWVNTHSGQWESTHTDVNAQSADWRNGYLVSLANHSTLNSNSGKWESNYSTTYNNSGDWENVWAHVNVLSSDWNASGAGAWSVNAESEVFRLSNVGIGTSNPSYPLDVVGDVRVTGNLTVEGISKDFKTSDKAITINHASTTNSSGSAGIEIEENSKVRGSLKINANRGGWTLLEPLSTRQLVFALSGHIGGTSTWNVSAGLDVEDPSAINQDVTTDATNVQFGKLGIGIAPSEELTVAGSISAQDLIYTGAGQSTEWQSTYTDFKALSGDIGNEATVRLLSGNWHSTYTDVNANSANWVWAYSNAVSGTANGNWAHANSISGTDLWNWSYANSISGTDLWNWAHANNLSGTDIWNWAHANAVSGTDNWNTAYTDSQLNKTDITNIANASGDWDGTHTTVNVNSAIWTWGASNSATIYEDLTVHGSISARDILTAGNGTIGANLSGDVHIAGNLSATDIAVEGDMYIHSSSVGSGPGVANPTDGILHFSKVFDNSGAATANKIVLYDDGGVGQQWKAGLGISSSDFDLFSGDNFRFWTNHGSTDQGDNRVTILAGGNVGIGTDDPTYLLDVAGDIGVDEYIYHNGDSNTYIRMRNDIVNFVAGGQSAFKLETSTGKIQLNNGNNDLDTQIMSDDGSAILHIDAGTNRAGVNTTTPNEALTVVGNITANGIIYASGGNSDQWNSAYATVYSTSASWSTTFADVTRQIDEWNSTWTTLTANSAEWEAAYEKVITLQSGEWDNTWHTVSGLSAAWTSTNTDVNANSAKWDEAYTEHLTGASFNTANGVVTFTRQDAGTLTIDLDGRYALADTGSIDAQSVYGTVNILSASWTSATTDMFATSAKWDWAYNNALTGTDIWNWAHSNALTGTDLWNWSSSNLISGADGWTSTNTDVNANSALWTSVYSTVQANSGTGTNNYVARWVNAKKIGDSSIYNDGTYTGMGTTAPLAKLVVSGGNVLHPEISATSVFTSSVTALTGVVGSVRGVDSSTVNFHDSISVNSNVQAVTFNGINLDSLSLDVHASSGNWNNTYSTLGTYSGAWVSTNAEVAAHSGHWTNSYNTLTGLSAAWVSTNTDVAANSGKWNTTHSVVNLLSSTWSNSVSGVSAERIGKTFTQTNTFTAGRVIRRDVNGSFQLAKANAPLSADVVGVIQSADTAKFDVVFSGILNFPSHGFTVGKPIYLSDTWDGALTETEPTAAGTVTKPVGIVIDASVIQVMPYRGIYNNAVINSSVYSTVNTNSADWNYVAANSGAGASLRSTISQSNSFSAGRVVRVNSSGNYVTSKADNVDSADVVGVVSYATGSSFTVYYGGVMAWTSHGKTIGSNLFLSNGHTGWLTETPVTDANSFNKPVAFVLNANSVLVWPQRGIQNTTSGGGGGGGGGSDVSSLSSDWENTHTIVNANSGYWGQTVTTVRANSGHWTTVVKDQGSTITSNASAFNFVGNGVVATVDTTGTVQVSSFDATGGGGGSSRTDFEIMMAASVFR